MRILIHSIAYIDMVNDAPTEDGYLVLDGEHIAAVGPGKPPFSYENFDEVVDGRNKLALPGFINTHGHAAMTTLRGFADDLPLQEWLSSKIWPAEALLDGDDIYWGTQLAMMEMLQTGTTTFADMYFHMDRVATAVIESGMRAVLCRGLIGVAPNGDDALADGESFAAAFHKAGNGRIHTTLGPHAPYTCPPEYLKRVMAAAERISVPMQIHVSETEKEVRDITDQYGLPPGEWLDSLGLFEHPVIAAHCVHLTDREMDIFAKKAVHIAHNPGSNLKLASGVAPLAEFLQRGLTVGLGTDGAASNNKLDLFAEVRLAALLHKGVSGDATVVPALTALRLATRDGAKTLFMDPKLGTLAPGAPADVQLIDISGPRYFPRHNLVAHAVYSSCASDVTDVYVAGRALYRDREWLTIDKERVLAETERIGRKLRGSD